VEPQSGPPDAFNLAQRVLLPGEVPEVSLVIAFDRFATRATSSFTRAQEIPLSRF